MIQEYKNSPSTHTEKRYQRRYSLSQEVALITIMTASFTRAGLELSIAPPNQRMKLTARGGRMKGKESFWSAAATGCSLCAIR